MKKPDYLLPFARLFTCADGDAYDSLAFQSSDTCGDDASPALAAPVTWGATAVAALADEAACARIPADLTAIEENTVPSWLWRHRPRGTRRAAEGDLRDIFNRAVGAAAAKAWQDRLFTSERHARAFYDETRLALMQRHIVLAPQVLATWGLSWAYGIEQPATEMPVVKESPALLSNATIDALTRADADATTSGLWNKLFGVKDDRKSAVTLRLSDIAQDWHGVAANPARAAIDVLALRHSDGSVHIDALRQAARLLTILLDLHDRGDVTIGLANIAPLLLGLGLAYDSEAGRAMAASITALVTAECYAASAEMAALRGASEAFSRDREAVMRALRNHRRAVYGDGNDYEKLSVAPPPLPLKNCPDLALAAQSQRRWDDALEAARVFGLRATQVTDLTPSPILGIVMECAAQGLEPMPRLTALRETDGHYQTALHPAAVEALARLDYPRPSIRAAAQHIAGTHALTRAPGVGHAALLAAGLSATAVEKIESYLPCVDSVRLAVTPWIVGVDFCRRQLKIPARVLQSPRFDLLRHLGFSDADVKAADLHCYGHGTARNARALQLRHRPLFACGLEISAEARIRMAAAAQGFISGDTGVVAALPAQRGVAGGAVATLSAWRRGLKSLTLIFDPAIAVQPVREAPASARRIKPASHPHAAPVVVEPRRLSVGKAPAIHLPKSESDKRLRRH